MVIFEPDFFHSYRGELRTRCTTQVWALARGQGAPSTSDRPSSPPQQTMLALGDAAVAQFGEHVCPLLPAFPRQWGHLQPEDLMVPVEVEVETDGHVDGMVRDLALGLSWAARR